MSWMSDLPEHVRVNRAAWDQEAFDPGYDTLPIDTFVPMVREVFSRPASGFGAPDD